jgi:hypothetical protein
VLAFRNPSSWLALPEKITSQDGVISCKHSGQAHFKRTLGNATWLAHDLGYGGPSRRKDESPGGSQLNAYAKAILADSWLLSRCFWRDIKGAALAWLDKLGRVHEERLNFLAR